MTRSARAARGATDRVLQSVRRAVDRTANGPAIERRMEANPRVRCDPGMARAACPLPGDAFLGCRRLGTAALRAFPTLDAVIAAEAPQKGLHFLPGLQVLRALCNVEAP